MTRFTCTRVGASIGPYVIESLLGVGGMARVYAARRDMQSPKVALKVLHPFLAEDETFLLMLQDEARLSAFIQHPNVGRLVDWGQDRGTHYLAFEYVDGCSLAQLMEAVRIERRGVPPALAAAVGLRVVRALDAAHTARDPSGRWLQLVHRDVSPENILLGSEGDVRLIDFGIARASGRRHHTRVETLKGKLRYMSPEQARGLPVDARCDLFSLGVVLWELVTQRPLYQSNSDTELLERIRHPAIPSPNVDPALDAVILRATATDPSDRYESAAEMERALLACVPLDARFGPLRWSTRLSAFIRRAREADGRPPTLPENDRVTQPNAPRVEDADESGTRRVRNPLASVPAQQQPVMHPSLAKTSQTFRAKKRPVVVALPPPPAPELPPERPRFSELQYFSDLDEEEMTATLVRRERAPQGLPSVESYPEELYPIGTEGRPALWRALAAGMCFTIAAMAGGAVLVTKLLPGTHAPSVTLPVASNEEPTPRIAAFEPEPVPPSAPTRVDIVEPDPAPIEDLAESEALAANEAPLPRRPSRVRLGPIELESPHEPVVAAVVAEETAEPPPEVAVASAPEPPAVEAEAVVAEAPPELEHSADAREEDVSMEPAVASEPAARRPRRALPRRIEAAEDEEPETVPPPPTEGRSWPGRIFVDAT